MSDPIEWKISTEPVPYEVALEAMKLHVEAMIAEEEPERIWLLEHPPVYTAGTSAKKEDLLDHHRFPIYEVGRGGEYTYHGPGQRIAYVMLDLKKRKLQDLHGYVHLLEQWVINTLARLNITGVRRQGRIGIWICDEKSENKIAAIGVRVRKWKSFHGIALNVHPDLSHFAGIVPCGIKEYGVTSLKELNQSVTFEELDSLLKEEFIALFQ